MKQIIHVSGMHCTHCSMRVRDAIKGVSGVKKVKVNLKKRTACIVSEVAITRQSLEKALLLVGYQLDEEAHP
ncbi:MAG: cation transporter [Candidatus Izemoplasmatales bacterium]|nr:cation transporter [Candidatus Izemoplasmatales bacterium]MDD4355362.1 cation transporter [Candidatus Izemoplasmatales bacterium]MDD4988297.1 cation transporter [Candidatus Izemoplasmatales bacterium]MDD5601730.1 cation transporter [Candidatus Izemoplasmatales bacterium]NLF49440.1 hypothetical protein [Acholeplasmataceae bacterium]